MTNSNVMSVAINADDAESLRAEVETEYRHEDSEVPDETTAQITTSSDDSTCC